jgi:ribose transport system ATP-binding protein
MTTTMVGGPSPASAGAPAEEGDALQLDAVRRTFGETVALDGVSLTCRAGTVHTILGENGSGKSTLVKLLSGILAPDDGEVRIGGQVLRPRTPRRARELGVATVFQEVLVATGRSVTENVLLGQDRWTRWAVRGDERRDRALSVLREVSSHPFDPAAPVAELGLVQRHQVAIARALMTEPRVLVLDESTAALDVGERDRLFEALRRRVAQGVSVIFISHRLDEVLELSDEVTVLRSGRHIATLGRAELKADRLLALLNPDAVGLR